jgi:hypothetical protein
MLRYSQLLWNNIMYSRFVSPLRAYSRGVNWGIFQAAYACRDNENTPEYLHQPIVEEINWFKKNLTSPDSRFFDEGRVPKHIARICWFRANAREMIEHAYCLKFLLDEAGVFISVIKTKHPGVIHYKDEFQVVAQPEKSTQTHWR